MFPMKARTSFWVQSALLSLSKNVLSVNPNIYKLNRPFLWAVFLCLVLLISGCSKKPLKLEYFAKAQDNPNSFYICRAYGCRERSEVQLTDEEWSVVEARFSDVQDAAEERRVIADSVAAMETLVGQKTGTSKDRAAATMRGHGPFQMDCIDETVNTSLYLQFFGAKGLMQFHEIMIPARRGAFIDGAWPHNTAVIMDLETQEKYAIDSWYGKNGDAADVVPLQEWLDGWRPE